MTVFEKMINSVRASNPDLITEQQAAQLSKEFDTQLNQIKADATAEGQALGFKEGYEEGKKAAADEAKVQLDAMVEKLDTESTQKLTKILEMIDEDHTKKLQEVFEYLEANKNEAIDKALADQDAEYAQKFETAINAVNDNHANMLTEAVNKVDEKHAKQLTSLYKALDKKHAKMIEEAVSAVDAANAKKLEKVYSVCKENQQKAVKLVSEEITKKFKIQLKKKELLFESKLKEKEQALIEEQKHKLSVLAESVEKYINYALEQNIPKKQLISEAKYNAALKTIDKVVDILKVNTIIQESKDGIFADYQSKIASEKESQQKLINENIQLKAKLDKKEAQLVLEQKCKECTPSEAKFLRTYFKGAAKAKIIEESIDEAKSAFKKLQTERRQSLIDESSKNVSATPAAVVTESKKEETKEPAKKQVTSVQNAVKSKPTVVDISAEMLSKKA